MITALTGWGQREDRQRTAEAGFDHRLVKPPDVKTLEALLDRSLSAFVYLPESAGCSGAGHAPLLQPQRSNAQVGRDRVTSRMNSFTASLEGR